MTDVRNLNDLAHLLSERDDISLNEAWNMIEECQREINQAFYYGEPSLWEIEDIIADVLGLEPDYLDLLIT